MKEIFNVFIFNSFNVKRKNKHFRQNLFFYFRKGKKDTNEVIGVICLTERTRQNLINKFRSGNAQVVTQVLTER